MRWILIIAIILVLAGCATTQPKINATIQGDFQGVPQSYSISLTM